MTAFRRLPLGIDIGTTRIRIASAGGNSDGEMRLNAVVSRELPQNISSFEGATGCELLASIIGEMRVELDTRERRCILSLGIPDAALRVMKLPKMSWAERTRVARFEAQRFASWDLNQEPSLVRIHPSDRDAGLYAIGAVRRESVETRIAAVRAAGLKVVAIDHDAFALRRGLPRFDAIVDVGAERTVLHAFTEIGPLSWIVAGGGHEVTNGIAADLCVDFATAERRKRILGSAGAGSAARDRLVNQIRGGIDLARGRVDIASVALTGNGARLPGLLQAVRDAVSATVEMPVAHALMSDAYPEDIIRAAAPDWTLAVSLVTHGAVA